MNTRTTSNEAPVRRRRRRAPRVAGALLATMAVAMSATSAGAGSVDREATNTGCLDGTGADVGRIYLVATGTAPLRACDPGDTTIRLAGGDITSVAAGPGLRVTSDPLGIVDTEGSATVELAPGYRLPQNCSAEQAAVRRGAEWACRSLPVVPRREIVAGRSSRAEIAYPISDSMANITDPLTVPAGAWAITAKLQVHGRSSCRLDVTGNTDADEAWTLEGGTFVLAFSVNWDKEFTVAVACEDYGEGTAWSDLVITAVPADKATTWRLEPHH